MIYLRLFHGRIDPERDMDDWGSDGPVFGPLCFVHTTYASIVRLGREDGNCDELFLYGDMLYYGGIYYGDWSVFDENTRNGGDYGSTPFDESKARLPLPK